MAPSFSIREYAASMRGTPASRRPIVGAAGDFPPMPAPRFRWWVDELHAAVSSISPPAPAPEARKKRRSISDIFADNQWKKKPRSEEEDDCFGKMKKKGILFSSSTPKTFQVHERQKDINIEKAGKFKKNTQRCVGGTKTVNTYKLINSGMVHPKHSTQKKHTKRSSVTVSINKEKCSNLKETESKELLHKLGKHVTFSGVDGHCNVYSDNSNEAEKLVPANTSSHKNKETYFKANQSERDIYDRGASESRGAEDPLNLIDLNHVVPCIPDFNCTFISGSEVPALAHTGDATSEPQIPGDVREAFLKHKIELHSRSQQLQGEPSNCDEGRIINSRSKASLLPDDAIRIADRGMIGHPLNSREVTKLYGDYDRSSVRESFMKGKAPCILPHHTVQYTSQFSESWYTNVNLGNFHHTGRKFSSCPCQNQLNAEKPMLHSDIDVQRDHAFISQHTIRLMGKDLTVSTTGGKCIDETGKEHVDAPSTSHDYVGHRMHHVRRRFSENDVFSGNGIECKDRPLRNFSYLNCSQNAPVRLSPLQGNCNKRSGQNLLSAKTFLPTFMPHVKKPSVYHANSTRTHNPYPANLLVHPPDPDGTNFGKEQNQIISGVAEIPSAVDIVSRDTVRMTMKANVDNCNISSGPVKLRPGAKHVLEPRQNTDDGNYPPRA
uniref:Uncharacterized protein n=1 Tax=Leersia perrieri TaxID=77586 RepID=A0A0D9WDR8_9ORYZ